MHVPVLLNKAIELINPKEGDLIIDGTFGAGGHAYAILGKILPSGTLLGIDLDSDAIARGMEKFANRENVILANDNYKNIPDVLKEKNLPKADGLLLDLGMSSEQLEESGRGFSFKKDEPLDMRYGKIGEITAAEVINSFGKDALEEIFKKYGEERYARQIAKKIVERRKQSRIMTTFQLSEIAEEIYRSYGYRHGQSRQRIHPATRIFQALRIYVNGELENLEKIFDSLPNVLKSGGRAAVISFHSLEDRIVKNKFKEMSARNILEILTKKPIIPDAEEIKNNPRARSAKLRAAILI